MEISEVMHFRLSRDCTVTIHLHGLPTREAIYKIAKVLHFIANADIYPSENETSANLNDASVP